MKVLVWATSFGAELRSFTRYLDRREDVTVKVVMDRPRLFREQAVAQLHPLQCELIGRRFHHHLLGKPFFRPDVTIIDNRVPLRASSSKGFVLVTHPPGLDRGTSA